MIKHTLLVLLLYSTSAYTTEWKHTIKIDKTSVYQDIDSAEPFEGGLFIWAKYDFSPPKILNGVGLKQMKTLTAFICDKNIPEYSIIRMLFYDKNDNLINDTTPESIKFEPVSSGDLLMLMQLINACSLIK